MCKTLDSCTVLQSDLQKHLAVVIAWCNDNNYKEERETTQAGINKPKRALIMKENELLNYGNMAFVLAWQPPAELI